MGAMISSRVVVNVRNRDGTVRRRFDFKDNMRFSEVKLRMAECVYGVHARRLPPSRIRLRALPNAPLSSPVHTPAPPRPMAKARPAAQQPSGVHDAGSDAAPAAPGAAVAPSTSPQPGTGAAAGSSTSGTAPRTPPPPPAPALAAHKDSRQSAAHGGSTMLSTDAGFAIDSVGGLTNELVVVVFVLPAPDTGFSTPRRSMHGRPARLGTPASPGSVGTAAGPGSPADVATPMSATVEPPRLGYADESERKLAHSTSVVRLRDDAPVPAGAGYNLVMTGGTGVGKSSLLERFTKDQFKQHQVTTMGIDMKVMNVMFDDVHVRLRLWDSSGQRAFNSITQTYLRNAHGVLAVFDVTKRSTYEQAKEWVHFVTQSTSFASGKSTVILIGNKTDMEGRKVPQLEAHEWAVARKLPYFETSAKDGIGIQAPFHFLGMRIARACPPLRSPASPSAKSPRGRGLSSPSSCRTPGATSPGRYASAPAAADDDDSRCAIL